MTEARKPRGVKRSTVAASEDVQVLIRLPQTQVDALDAIAKKHKLSRTKAAQFALESALKSGGDLSTKSDINRLALDFKRTITDEIVKSIKASSSVNQFYYLKKEIESMKQDINSLAVAISKK